MLTPPGTFPFLPDNFPLNPLNPIPTFPHHFIILLLFSETIFLFSDNINRIDIVSGFDIVIYMKIDTIICETKLATSDFLPESKEPLCASEEVIREAIFVSQGNLTRAARLLNCSHKSLHSYVKRNEEMKRYLEAVLEYRNDVRADVLEDLAFNKALMGDTTMIWKLLCVYAGNRGYGDKQQVNLKHEIPPGVRAMIDSLEAMRNGVESKAAESTQGSDKEDKHI
jgi:hypothetical protein